tara:strand:+ start:19 stop:1509 length:1491 start_codon:yes stop_codon:yes gene_type:complete
MKQIVKKFNNVVKKTIFKVRNKTNNNFKISNFNKYLIFFIGLIFLYLFYLLIPLLYEKSWVQTSIENKLLSEFKMNLSTSADISYRILPAPHFLVNDSKILVSDLEKQKSIAEIKDLKVFLSQRNFFNKEKMNFTKVIISAANFSLLRSDLKLLSKPKNNKFSNKKIIVKNSNIFFKDNSNEIISIIKINKATLFFDDEKISNLLNLNGEVFNVPFKLNLINRNNPAKYLEINFQSKLLKLKIYNEHSTKKNNSASGESVILFLNSKINTKHHIDKNLIIYESKNSKIKNSNFNYRGELSINPFDLDLNIYLDNYKISKLFSINPLLIEVIKSELLFNKNISVNNTVVINSNLKKELFQSAKINLRIINGKINFNNTIFVNNKIGSLTLRNSNLFVKNKNLILNTDIFLDIKNSDHIFSSLNTNKSLRKNMKNVLINLDYNFFNHEIKFNNIKVDNHEISEQSLRITDEFNAGNLNKLNRSRRVINKILKAIYEEG